MQARTILRTFARWSPSALARPARPASRSHPTFPQVSPEAVASTVSRAPSGSGSIRKAREQVGAHNIAGQPNNGNVAGNGGEHFVNTETVSRVGFGDRTIPDVHLTRFAAYFVALNADQSKPESAALDTLRRGTTRPAGVKCVTVSRSPLTRQTSLCYAPSTPVNTRRGITSPAPNRPHQYCNSRKALHPHPAHNVIHIGTPFFAPCCVILWSPL